MFTLMEPIKYLDKIIQPKRICIDIDGVVCEYDFPKLIKKHFGVDLGDRPIYAYNIPDTLGVDPKTVDSMFREQVFGKPDFAKGAIDTLIDWKIKGHELVIYSNRVNYMGHEGLLIWLIEWQIPFTGIDSGQGYYDIHIDDRPSKLLSTNSDLKLLYNQPWNEGCYNLEEKLIRVHSWKEIRDYV